MDNSSDISSIGIFSKISYTGLTLTSSSLVTAVRLFYIIVTLYIVMCTGNFSQCAKFCLHLEHIKV